MFHVGRNLSLRERIHKKLPLCYYQLEHGLLYFSALSLLLKTKYRNKQNKTKPRLTDTRNRVVVVKVRGL